MGTHAVADDFLLAEYPAMVNGEMSSLLEVLANLLYLIRSTSYDSEPMERFVAAAEQKVVEISKILNRLTISNPTGGEPSTPFAP